MIALRWRSLGARSGAVRRARKGRLGPGPEALNAWLPSDIGGPQVALGRAGGGPKVVPWWEAALVALCGARGRDLRSPTFPRLAPPRLWLGLAPRSSAGPNFERFLERCPLDSKFSCDNIWVSKCMLFLRSSNLFDGWLDLPPLGHALYNHTTFPPLFFTLPKHAFGARGRAGRA